LLFPNAMSSFDKGGIGKLGVTPPHEPSSNSNSPPRSLLNDLATPGGIADHGSKRSRNQKPPPGTPQTPPAKRESRTNAEPPDMVVLVTRTDMYDSEKHNEDSEASQSPSNLALPDPPVAEYRYDPTQIASGDAFVMVRRVRSSPAVSQPFWMELNVFDKSVPNPYDRSIQKYWNQRRRLFSRFDQGVLLDEEGWFSVTPEQIADHVATRTVDLYKSTQPTTSSENDLIVLDAFCGCGGNSIAFAKHASVKLVVCVDIDRTKLLRAASNAFIYDIPVHKIVFIECNVLFLLEHCYMNGVFVLDQPIDTPEKAEAMMSAMPPPVPVETTIHGYHVGGIDMLPPRIVAVFMDPPWGGVDYSVFGKNGYCLERNMRIPRPANQIRSLPHSVEGVSDGFFDSFCVSPRNKEERMAAFNSGRDENNCVNGADLLRLAASAAANALVIYDVPRNTNRISVGQAAIKAGYRGNCKLEEHYLNHRLKTVTVYFGRDWRADL
jgi:trimethylguanosine synthase